jgi:hypothetical protein
VNALAPRKLTLSDIADLRAYERERPELLARVIELKRRRRVAVGTLVTLLFESRDTVRFQIQEMARVEKLISDEAVQNELDVYNPLIPEPGQLSATMFIELTSEEALREWLPRLVGIERTVEIRFPDGSTSQGVTEEQHASQLTRDDITSTVHYVRFELSAEQVVALSGPDPVIVAVTHPDYREEVELAPSTVAELATDAAH